MMMMTTTMKSTGVFRLPKLGDGFDQLGLFHPQGISHMRKQCLKVVEIEGLPTNSEGSI